jgi:hypothetical protein
MKYEITEREREWYKLIIVSYDFGGLFPGIVNKSAPFANKRYQSQNFAVNWCIIWISNEWCPKGANKYSNALDKIYLWKWNTLIGNIF